MSTDDRLTMALFASDEAAAQRNGDADAVLRGCVRQFIHRWSMPWNQESMEQELNELIALAKERTE